MFVPLLLALHFPTPTFYFQPFLFHLSNADTCWQVLGAQSSAVTSLARTAPAAASEKPPVAPAANARRTPRGQTPSAILASVPKDSSSEMGCSSGRQPPAPVLHPDLDCGNNSEANTLPQDSENQNQGLNGLGEAGEEDGRDLAKPPESLPTLERLAQATGGTEKSWYRCVFPFGVISLVIGMAGTGVTFTFNTLLQTKVVSVALLCVGALMLLVAVVCWRAHRLRRRKKKEGGFFTADQGTL